MVGTVFPFAKSRDHGFRQPSVSILSACKAINLEAQQFLFRNTINLSCHKENEQLFQNSLNTPELRLLLKSVELTFEPTDCGDTAEDAFAIGVKASYGSIDAALNDVPDMQNSSCQYHQPTKAQLCHVSWPRKVRSLLLHTRLDRLTLDLTRAHCVPECCRLETAAILSLRDGFRLGHVPKQVKVRGMTGFEDTDEPTQMDLLVHRLLKKWTLRENSESSLLEDLGPNVEEELQSDVAREINRPMTSRRSRNRLFRAAPNYSRSRSFTALLPPPDFMVQDLSHTVGLSLEPYTVGLLPAMVA